MWTNALKILKLYNIDKWLFRCGTLTEKPFQLATMGQFNNYAYIKSDIAGWIVKVCNRCWIFGWEDFWNLYVEVETRNYCNDKKCTYIFWHKICSTRLYKSKEKLSINSADVQEDRWKRQQRISKYIKDT